MGRAVVALILWILCPSRRKCVYFVKVVASPHMFQVLIFGFDLEHQTDGSRAENPITSECLSINKQI